MDGTLCYMLCIFHSSKHSKFQNVYLFQIKCVLSQTKLIWEWEWNGYLFPLELHFPSKLNAPPHVAREASPSDMKQLKHKDRTQCMCYFFFFREIGADILFLFNSSNSSLQFPIILFRCLKLFEAVFCV